MEYFDNIKTANELYEHKANWQEKDMNSDIDRSVDPDYEDSMRSVMDRDKRITSLGDANHESAFISVIGGVARVETSVIARAMHNLGCDSDYIKERTSS